ncbi:MAG: peptide chain release factor N(5)-glutamine methyltransferase [Bacteroidota bacterium]|nr:peptide chain release factor N(5)-glutamine methyltransferase [Bacteroidota bacterium]
MSNENTWTIKKLLDWSANYLNEKGFDDSRLNAELLICHMLNYKNRIDLYLHHDKPLRETELKSFKELFKRRLNREPLQYIIGEAQFMGLKFKVDKRVLIPRPETEMLVEAVIETSQNYPNGLDILDIGVGSGNIAVSLAKFISAANVTGIDASRPAIEMARTNVDANGVFDRIDLKQLNIFDDVSGLPKYDIIVSNPPYISRNEFLGIQEEIRLFEPHSATTDDSDGLTYHRRIADVARNIFKENGWLFLEIAYNQSVEVTKICSEFGYYKIETIKDYSDNDRVIKARWSK